jgi:hypothetical protein
MAFSLGPSQTVLSRAARLLRDAARYTLTRHQVLHAHIAPPQQIG